MFLLGKSLQRNSYNSPSRNFLAKFGIWKKVLVRAMMSSDVLKTNIFAFLFRKTEELTTFVAYVCNIIFVKTMNCISILRFQNQFANMKLNVKNDAVGAICNSVEDQRPEDASSSNVTNIIFYISMKNQNSDKIGQTLCRTFTCFKVSQKLFWVATNLPVQKIIL